MPKSAGFVYSQIEAYITDLLNKGTLRSGNSLPTERELSERFRVSRIPVRQALQKLEDRGIIERRQGKGTFVREDISTDTGKLGILFSHDEQGLFTSPTHSRLVSGIDSAAREYHKDLLFRSITRGGSPAYEEKLIKTAQEVDGIIIVDSQRRVWDRIERNVSTFNGPLIVLFYEGETEKTDFIITDSRANTSTVIGFLKKNGHQKIACSYEIDAWDLGIRANHAQRVQGYKDALAKHGLAVKEELVFCSSDADERTRLQEILSRPDRPTAVFCTTAVQAGRIYQMAREAGLKVPDDLSVIGYGDSVEIATMDPPLTTIRHPLEEMGRATVVRLMEKIEECKKEINTARTTAFAGELVVRGSHRDLKSQIPNPKSQ